MSTFCTEIMRIVGPALGPEAVSPEQSTRNLIVIQGLGARFTTAGLASGDRLHLHLADGRLVLERQSDAVAALRRIGAVIPQARSLVDELLAERRATASLE